MTLKNALKRLSLAPLLLAIVGCGGPQTAVDESELVTRCDKYQQRVCEDYGPSGRIICSCELADGYDCDPLVETGSYCIAGLWKVCSAGHWVLPPGDGGACTP
jgi:hypothetical protein